MKEKLWGPVSRSCQWYRSATSKPLHRYCWLLSCSKLGLHLPHPVDSKNGRAQWDASKCLLSVNLQMVREYDFMNFWHCLNTGSVRRVMSHIQKAVWPIHHSVNLLWHYYIWWWEMDSGRPHSVDSCKCQGNNHSGLYKLLTHDKPPEQ